MLIENILFFVLSAIALIVSSIFLVKSLGKISLFLRISEFTAAFIIMAIATSLPELFVGISSALAGSPALSLGNIIGANIIDITLIIGIFVLISGSIKVKRQRTGKDVYYVLASVILFLTLFLIGNSLSRIDGGILLGFFILNSYRVLRKRKKYTAKYKEEEKPTKMLVISSVFIFIISLIVLFIASKYAVVNAIVLAEALNLPQILMGIFLISLATTLPEFIFGLQACRLSHQQMAIGDQTGTIFVNSTLILGIVALIHPIEAAFTPFLISAIFLFVSVFVFITFIKSEHKLTLWEGLSLIFLYVLFMILEFFAKP